MPVVDFLRTRKQLLFKVDGNTGIPPFFFKWYIENIEYTDNTNNTENIEILNKSNISQLSKN